MSLVHWNADRPNLRHPLLVIALDGFVDAGAAASTAATFLRHRWRSDVIATFDRDALLDHRARRPTGVLDGGQVRRVEWPEIELCAAEIEGAHDVYLLLGPEPDMRWEQFCCELAELALALGVEAVVGLGAYPAATPHTRPFSVLQAGNALGGALAPGIAPVQAYSGPVDLATALQPGLEARGLPAVGLWAEVPHYIAGSSVPGAALALVDGVADIVGTAVDTTELQAAATIHRKQVDEAVADHGEAAEMITALEAHADSGVNEDDLPSADDLAGEIERFLRTQEG